MFHFMEMIIFVPKNKMGCRLACSVMAALYLFLLQAFNRLLNKKPPATIKTKKEKFKEIIKSIIRVSFIVKQTQVKPQKLCTYAPLKCKKLTFLSQKHVSEAYKHKVTFDLPEMQFKRKEKNGDFDTVNLSNLFEDSQQYKVQNLQTVW